MSRRFENDEKAREASGFAKSTYKTIFENIEKEQSEGKRTFIKDIIYYLFPENGVPAQLAPSLSKSKRGIGTHIETAVKETPDETTNGHTGDKGGAPFPYGTLHEAGNPTVIPSELLKQFHWTFLIRDPHYSIPSWWRCCIPPLDEVTGFYEFYASEAGYDEVRRMFDFLVASGQVGPLVAGKPELEGSAVQANGQLGANKRAEICVVDADDLLDNPAGIIQEYCSSIGLDYRPSMLTWDDEKLQTTARAKFEKWAGFHEDVLESKDLRPRVHKKQKKTEAEFDLEWTQKYGLKAANIIRKIVDDAMPSYRYLKQFAIEGVKEQASNGTEEMGKTGIEEQAINGTGGQENSSVQKLGDNTTEEQEAKALRDRITAL